VRGRYSRGGRRRHGSWEGCGGGKPCRGGAAGAGSVDAHGEKMVGVSARGQDLGKEAAARGISCLTKRFMRGFRVSYPGVTLSCAWQ
jgi:hypothetical protein